MAKSKTSSKGKQAQYARYQSENRAASNKRKRIAKYVKQNPNYTIPESIVYGHTRKTPKSSTLTKQQKRIIELLHEFKLKKGDIETVVKNLETLKKQSNELRKTWNLLKNNLKGNLS